MSLKQHLKPLAGIAAVAGLALALTACGGNSGSAATAAAASGSSEDNVITVGASPSPHAEILNAVADELKSEGYELKVVEYNDYVQPNVALDAGDLDANYFQHLPYLENYNDENGTDLVSAGAIHFEPMGLYAGKSSDINNVPDGAKIAVPSDATISVSLSGGSPVVEPRPSLPNANDVSETGHVRASWLARSFEGIRNAEPLRAVHSLFSGEVLRDQDADQVEVNDARDTEQPEALAAAALRPAMPPATFMDLPGSADLVEPSGINLSTYEVAYQSIATMQNLIERYRAAASPAQVHITVPYASGGTLDFHRATELIELGRQRAIEAFDRAGI